jgi:trimethylamine:corrinoid methyltransferase-like protein
LKGTVSDGGHVGRNRNRNIRNDKRDGAAIAVLAKPNYTPITDSLLGILKDSGINNADDIKAMRLGV